MYERILLPTDGSEGTEHAVDHAIALAKQFGAALDVLHVTDAPVLPLDAHSQALLDAIEEEGRSAVEEIVERASRRGVGTVAGVVREGEPYRTILDYVDEEDVDLVVMGTHGRTGLDRYLLGSVTERVARLSDVPVVIVPRPEEAAED